MKNERAGLEDSNASVELNNCVKVDPSLLPDKIQLFIEAPGPRAFNANLQILTGSGHFICSQPGAEAEL